MKVIKYNFFGSATVCKIALEKIKIDNLNKISEELDGMSKAELVKMSKTLINITRLKQIISSERETVGRNDSTYVLSLKNGIEKIK